jgi:hypothetical protein
MGIKRVGVANTCALHASIFALTGCGGGGSGSSPAALTPIVGSPFAAQDQYPHFISIHPSGKFAFGSDEDNGNVYGYADDSVTGALTPMSGSPYQDLGIYGEEITISN